MAAHLAAVAGLHELVPRGGRAERATASKLDRVLPYTVPSTPLQMVTP